MGAFFGFFDWSFIGTLSPMSFRTIEVFLLVLLLQAAPVFGQFKTERTALNKIRKGEWVSARHILNKLLRKDSVNTEANYVYSLLFFSNRYSHFNIDSAYAYWQKTNAQFKLSDIRARERFKKFPLDSIILTRLREKIDSAAFEEAKLTNTETSYQYFLDRYTSASQRASAIELRDEAAFVVALKQNTYQSFQKFLDRYPESHRANEARSRYDKLYFEFSTRNKTLKEFQEFVSQNPESGYKVSAIKNIFELSTQEGTEQCFDEFIRSYPGNGFAKMAGNILLHLKIGRQQHSVLDDSLRKIYPLTDWMPITENNQWGFMDAEGKVTLQPTLVDVDRRYFCNPLNRDIIHTSEGVFARNGVLIKKGRFKMVNELGAGYFRVQTDSSFFVIHKGGWQLNLPPLTDIFILQSRYLAARQNKTWGLIALNGTTLLPFSFDRIVSHGRYIIFSRSGKELIVKTDDIVAYSRGEHEPIVADEIKTYGEKYIWIRNGSLEKLLDVNLKEIIPFDRQSITFSSAGPIVKKQGATKVMDWPDLKDRPLVSVDIYEPWMITREAGAKSKLHHIPSRKEVEPLADSIWFAQSFVTVLKNDSVYLWQSEDISFRFLKNENYAIRKSRDSIVYVLVSSKTKTTVYRAGSLKKTFTSLFREIEPVVRNVFIVKENGRQGLMNDKGEILLKPEYDAILFNNGIFSLLKNKRFGSYNALTKKLIKPTFESNLKLYSDKWITGKKGNKLAFLKSDGTNKTKFDYDEIGYWSDSVALVVKEGKRNLYAIPRGKVILNNLGAFEVLNEPGKERLAIFRENELYGLIGSTSGLILRPEFEEITYQTLEGEIVLIGIKPAEGENAELLYMHVDGKIIRKQILGKEIAFNIMCDN
jgi:hypothetical protein